MRKKGNKPPGGSGGKGSGGRGHRGNRPGKGRPPPKKLTPSQYGAMRARLVKTPSFVAKAIHNLPTAVPSLAKIFKEIPRQVKLTEAGIRQVEEHLTLSAVEAEMFRQGLSPDWGAIRMSFFVETAQGQAQITIEKTSTGWKMWVHDRSTA